MMISKIQGTQSFQSRQKLLSAKSFKNLSDILCKMNSETELVDKGYTFKSTITSLLKSEKNEVSFIDNRLLLGKVDKSKQNLSTSIIELGKKSNTVVTIDNETGKLIKVKKSIFRPLSKVMKKIDDALETFNLSFNNEKIVSKSRITFEGFNEEGVTYIRELEKSSQK